jgi:hypothetical protein
LVHLTINARAGHLTQHSVCPSITYESPLSHLEIFSTIPIIFRFIAIISVVLFPTTIYVVITTNLMLVVIATITNIIMNPVKAARLRLATVDLIVIITLMRASVDQIVEIMLITFNEQRT